MREDKIPNCQKRRTIFNLFEVSSCSSCKVLIKDEEYVFGEHTLYIYHLNDGCVLNEDYSKNEVINSKKLRTFLKDAIINQDKVLVLWLDSFNPDYRDNDFLNLLSFDLDVHIITF